jgi:ketosteroid isomerase-like protein
MVEDLLEALKRTWEAGDAPGAAQLYLENAIHQDGVGRQGSLLRGRVLIRKAIEEMFALRDSRFAVTSMFSIGRRGAAEWTFSWTDSKDGSRLEIHGASVFDFRDGLVARETSYYDPVPEPVRPRA